ncbi:MAG: alpha/beta hydrolase [Dehalococcoidia bacterium]|nr:alpha/beta hydrolase [Dehalococcoidia bacterium]MSQ16585.1 alpha/beta hydrolase [Dehalococcoidia bacterium]
MTTSGPAMSVHEVVSVPLHEGDTGQGLMIQTSRGDIPAILHQAPGLAESGESSRLGVIWVCGARGGFGGPGGGVYARLAERLCGQGITSLRLSYRQPNVFPECLLDLLAGVALLKGTGYAPVVLVGHSFGGAVVVAAGAASTHVRGVVSLSPQTYGAGMAGQLSPRSLLVVHGKADTRLPYSCGVQVHHWARQPKEIVLYEGAEHRLEECREELAALLERWLTTTLRAPPPSFDSGVDTAEPR